MQQENLWDDLLDLAGVNPEPAAERYKYFMRPEPYDGMGPIREEQDAVTGRPLRYRMMDVGMTRNAKNKSEFQVWLEPVPHIRILKAKDLQGWYKGKNDAVMGQRPRPCFTDAVLTEPYGGYCTVGCAFCYINSGFRGYRGSGLMTVPLNYGEQVRKQLVSMRTATAGYFSSFTDPFHPLEMYYHNTQRAAEAFVAEGLPVFFLSRLSYPGWAFDLLRRNRYSYAQKSLNTGVDADFKRLSPGALDLTSHIEEVRELRRQRIYTSIQVNPIIPGVISHDDIRLLFERLSDAGNNHVIVKFVEAGFSWAKTMVDRIRARFGDERADVFAALFTDNIGGQRTVAEEYRMDAHHLYRRWATELGMTYATCYEYRYERDASGEITSKLGVSVGREFTTAEQCHGHRVPMFSRDSPLETFAPMPECPPSGCLYCAEENNGAPRCGDEALGQARALKMSDFKRGRNK